MTYTDRYQQTQRYGASSNKGLIYFLIAILVILILAAITCPKDMEHRSAVTPLVTDLIQQNVKGLASSFGFNIQEVKENNFTNFFYESMIGKHVEEMMSNNFYVSDHIIYSTGYITSDDKTIRISIGCFGHVFTLGQLEGKFANGINLD